MHTPRYPLTVSVDLSHLYAFLHTGMVKSAINDVRAQIVDRFLMLDPTLDKDYVRGIVMATWQQATIMRTRPRSFKVVIQQPTDPLPELSREFLVGFVAQMLPSLIVKA